MSVPLREAILLSMSGFVDGMLLMTRPKADSVRSKSALEKLGFDVFIEPMFEVIYLQTEALDFAPYGMVVATSRNGIGAMAQCTKERAMSILTVGDSTMKYALSLGFTDVVSAGGTVNDLLFYLSSQVQRARILYVRGEVVSHDLKAAADNLGFATDEVVLYRTVPKDRFSVECLDLLSHGKISGVVFYSARTAEIFIKLIRSYSSLLQNIRAYSISENIRGILRSCPWKEVLISEYPTEESLFQLLLNIEI
ncbi:MAG: uroporphyrinogen-III synthase [Anaplasma sp.]